MKAKKDVMLEVGIIALKASSPFGKEVGRRGFGALAR
jgi:hypothetical protein